MNNTFYNKWNKKCLRIIKKETTKFIERRLQQCLLFGDKTGLIAKPLLKNN